MLTRGRIRLKTVPVPRAARWLLAAAWMGAIFYLSQQSDPLGSSPSTLQSSVAHLTLYAILAALLAWSLDGQARRDDSGLRALAAAVAFALTVLFGVTDELHQSFVPGRDASELDLALDAAGALLGLAAALGGQTLLQSLRGRAETPYRTP